LATGERIFLQVLEKIPLKGKTDCPGGNKKNEWTLEKKVIMIKISSVRIPEGRKRC